MDITSAKNFPSVNFPAPQVGWEMPVVPCEHGAKLRKRRNRAVRVSHPDLEQALLGVQQDQVRAGIAGLEREALNLLSGDDNQLTSSTSHTPAPLFSQSELAAV
jgi:hypothetical protein